MDENVISITVDIDKLSYKQLQAELKKRNVSSKGSAKDLKQRLAANVNPEKGKRKAEASPEEELAARIPRVEPDTESKQLKQLFAHYDLDQQMSENVAALLKKLTITWQRSNDLAFQQSIYGGCVKKPLPLRETLEFENYFSEDITGTATYNSFNLFVNQIQQSTSAGQRLKLGAVVQGNIGNIFNAINGQLLKLHAKHLDKDATKKIWPRLS